MTYARLRRPVVFAWQAVPSGAKLFAPGAADTGAEGVRIAGEKPHFVGYRQYNPCNFAICISCRSARRYIPDRTLTEFVLYTTHEPCAMCAGACVWARIGAVVYGVSQEDIAAYGRKRATEEYKWRACLIPCQLVFEKGNHAIPVIGGFLHEECKKLFRYRAGQERRTDVDASAHQGAGEVGIED